MKSWEKSILIFKSVSERQHPLPEREEGYCITVFSFFIISLIGHRK